MLSLIPLGPKLRFGPQIREAPLRLCGDGSSDTGGTEAELRGSAFPSRAWERGRSAQVPQDDEGHTRFVVDDAPARLLVERVSLNHKDPRLRVPDGSILRRQPETDVPRQHLAGYAVACEAI